MATPSGKQDRGDAKSVVSPMLGEHWMGTSDTTAEPLRLPAFRPTTISPLTPNFGDVAGKVLVSPGGELGGARSPPAGASLRLQVRDAALEYELARRELGRARRRRRALREQLEAAAEADAAAPRLRKDAGNVCGCIPLRFVALLSALNASAFGARRLWQSDRDMAEALREIFPASSVAVLMHGVQAYEAAQAVTGLVGLYAVWCCRSLWANRFFQSQFLLLKVWILATVVWMVACFATQGLLAGVILGTQVSIEIIVRIVLTWLIWQWLRYLVLVKCDDKFT